MSWCKYEPVERTRRTMSSQRQWNNVDYCHYQSISSIQVNITIKNRAWCNSWLDHMTTACVLHIANPVNHNIVVLVCSAIWIMQQTNSFRRQRGLCCAGDDRQQTLISARIDQWITAWRLSGKQRKVEEIKELLWVAFITTITFSCILYLNECFNLKML